MNHWKLSRCEFGQYEAVAGVFRRFVGASNAESEGVQVTAGHHRGVVEGVGYERSRRHR